MKLVPQVLIINVFYLRQKKKGMELRGGGGRRKKGCGWDKIGVVLPLHTILYNAGYRQFAICQRDEKNRWSSRKKGHTRDNVKIIYRRFAIRLFSRTIILSLIAWENPFVSCIITASTARWFEMWDTRNLSRDAA